MKTIVKTMAFMMTLFLLFQCDYYDPIRTDPIPKIDIPGASIYFPDQNYLNALIERGVDTNGDNIISIDEAESVRYLDISDENICDMTGIKEFRNLVTLDCHSNLLRTLDVSNNNLLENLSCQDNHLGILELYKIHI